MEEQSQSNKVVESSTSPSEAKVALLTQGEREILKSLAIGASNKEIAEQLQLSERTIRNRVSEILGKLGLNNRTQAAIWAREHELG